ncbi:MAG: SLC13 family permease [Anaerolineaceae bacterium]|nr:SLC13 family permease [Anaerolineaceae bacterium]
MTLDIALTFGVLLLAIVFFITEILRPDLVALIVLVLMVVFGLVSPGDALAGFSNPAVVAIWAMFILSSGLARTGVASFLGNQVMRVAGETERRLLTVLMTSSAILSAFMNNIGVAAMLLPVTIDIARRTKRVASRLLIPMAYGSLLGGMLLLFGTSSNLVVSGFVENTGLPPLGIFYFTPIGIVIFIVVLIYINLFGHRFLPRRQSPQPISPTQTPPAQNLQSLYGLEERLAMLVLTDDSLLAGKTLAESRISKALGLNILSVQRKNKKRMAPEANLVLEGGDRLLAIGKLDQIEKIIRSPIFTIESEVPTITRLLSEKIGLAEIQITEKSDFEGKTLVSAGFRQKFGVNVLANRRRDLIRRTNLQNMSLEAGDILLVEGLLDKLNTLADQPGYRILNLDDLREYHLEDRLLFIDIPEGSALAGQTLMEAKLGAAYGITVLDIVRAGQEWLFPEPSMQLEANDQLIVSGHPVDIEVLNGLQKIRIEKDVKFNLSEMENGSLSFVEVILSPYTSLIGKTLKQIRFREKFNVSVLAIWHGDRPYRTGLQDLPLQYGDAFLCYGTREGFELLAKERDFIVLRQDVQEKPRLKKAPIAGLIMLAVVSVVIAGWLPISIAAIAGSALMVLTRCITMEEAHKSIDWKAIFLIAAMMPLGFAMRDSGAAQFLADLVVQFVGPYGNLAILGGLMTLTLLINPFIPTVVNAVIMTPIGLATAASLGVSPYPFVMGIAYMVAACFMTPVSHPANLLVMSPGGYRFTDYLKNGVPIALLTLVVCLVLLPLVFPF